MSHPLQSFMLSTQDIKVSSLLRGGGDADEAKQRFTQTLPTDARAFLLWNQLSKKPSHAGNGAPTPSPRGSSARQSSGRIRSQRLSGVGGGAPQIVAGFTVPEKEVVLPTHNLFSTLSPSILHKLQQGLKMTQPYPLSSPLSSSMGAMGAQPGSPIGGGWAPLSSQAKEAADPNLAISGKISTLSPRPPSARPVSASLFLTEQPHQNQPHQNAEPLVSLPPLPEAEAPSPPELSTHITRPQDEEYKELNVAEDDEDGEAADEVEIAIQHQIDKQVRKEEQHTSIKDKLSQTAKRPMSSRPPSTSSRPLSAGPSAWEVQASARSIPDLSLIQELPGANQEQAI